MFILPDISHVQLSAVDWWSGIFVQSPLQKREGNWSGSASRSCFWDRYWRRAGQLLANCFSPVSVTVPEVFAKANSAHFSSGF